MSHVAFKVRTVPCQTTSIFARNLFLKIVSPQENMDNVGSVKITNILLFMCILLKEAEAAGHLRSHSRRQAPSSRSNSMISTDLGVAKIPTPGRS